MRLSGRICAYFKTAAPCLPLTNARPFLSRRLYSYGHADPGAARPWSRRRALRKETPVSPRDIVLCNPVRTAIGAFNGCLKTIPATDLGATAVRETLRRSRLE